MNQTGTEALVLGLGASGESAAALLLRQGRRVQVVDAARTPETEPRAARLEQLGARVTLGARDLPPGGFALCVISPGVPAQSPWVTELRSRNIPVWPEFEFGAQGFAGCVLAVTGTNGKSTVVKWLAEALAAAGLRARPAGNYGVPVCQAVLEEPSLDWLVIELSSFQLEMAVQFRPRVGLLLNLLPNHLDRHGTMEAYAAAKARLFAHLRHGDHAIVHEPALPWMVAQRDGHVAWRTFNGAGTCDYRYREGRVWRGSVLAADFRGTYFANDILGVNAAGAVAAIEACGLTPDCAEQAARAFQPLPHRMREVAVARGVRFVNDSKSTTLAALAAGLRMCPGPARLIAGGLLKEKDLDSVKKILAERAGAVYLIGQAMGVMASAWSGVVPCTQCGTLEAALAAAWRESRPGETILLSPGCASFDQFRNFAHRGEAFEQLVRQWTRDETSCPINYHGVR